MSSRSARSAPGSASWISIAPPPVHHRPASPGSRPTRRCAGRAHRCSRSRAGSGRWPGSTRRSRRRRGRRRGGDRGVDVAVGGRPRPTRRSPRRRRGYAPRPPARRHATAEHAPAIGAAGGDHLGGHARRRPVRPDGRWRSPARSRRRSRPSAARSAKSSTPSPITAAPSRCESVTSASSTAAWIALSADAGDDLPVDLDVVGRHLRQPQQAGVAGAHVVDRDGRATLTQQIEVAAEIDGLVDLLLGDLDDDAAQVVRPDVRCLDVRQRVRADVDRQQHGGRQVHAALRAPPRGSSASSSAPRPASCAVASTASVLARSAKRARASTASTLPVGHAMIGCRAMRSVGVDAARAIAAMRADAPGDARQATRHCHADGEPSLTACGPARRCYVNRV